MKKTTKIRVIYGLLLIPGFLLSIISAALFESNCHEQISISQQLKNYEIPLQFVRSISWIIVLLTLGSIITIAIPKHQPVLSFGFAVWIGIPCVLSLFHGLEMIFGKERYKKDVQEFNVSTEYNGNIAENLIKFLKNETIKEWKCCGLKSYKDLLPTNINKTFAIGKNAAKAQKIINDKQLTYKNYKYCFKTTYWTYCEDKNNNCTVFGPSANLSLVYEKKGCSNKLIETFDECKPFLALAYIVPWLVLLLVAIPTWCNLRQLQGVSPRKFGSVPTVSIEADNEVTKEIPNLPEPKTDQISSSSKVKVDPSVSPVTSNESTKQK